MILLQNPMMPISARVNVTAFDAPSSMALASCDKFPVKIAKRREIMLIIEKILPKISIISFLFLCKIAEFSKIYLHLLTKLTPHGILKIPRLYKSIFLKEA